MSIDAEHQSTTQPTAITSDSKGKSKEVNLSAHGDMSDSGEPKRFPFEQFPSPPGDKSRDARVPNATASLDPPLMEFIYPPPPPPPLANNPPWYARMVAEVNRRRVHVKIELELARTEAALALADVTHSEIELQAERKRMQDFMTRVEYVAGKNFVRKMTRKVEQSMAAGDEGEVHLQDTEEENFGDGDGESDEEAQDAKDGTDRESFSDGEAISLYVT
jgi:hypothetical protein